MCDYNWFMCFDCGNDFFPEVDDDPTSSSGCCKNCGSDHWTLYTTNITKKAYFQAKLKGEKLMVRKPISPIRYENRIWKVLERIA